MTAISRKLPMIEKFGYSLGDFGTNLIFQTVITFLVYFYTNVYKIASDRASLIIFSGGLVGAFSDILMGIIADRTKTRWGKFRPWILWTALPVGIMSMLVFSTPDFDANGKMIFALASFFLLMAVFSINNLAYCSLGGLMTGDMKERNSLSSYRFFAVMTAQFIVQSLLLPLASPVGHGDEARGFQKIMFLFAIAVAACLVITFLTTRERVPPISEERTPVSQHLRDLSNNGPWFSILMLTILIFITLALRGGMQVYYFKYYLDKGSLSVFLTNIGFDHFVDGLKRIIAQIGLGRFQWPSDAAISANSLFNACGIFFNILGISFSKTLADRFGKRDVFGLFLMLSALCLMLFGFYLPQQIGPVFLTQMLYGFLYGVTIPILWSMMADVADFGEWKNNRRSTAIIFCTMLFGLKIGSAVGGAIAAEQLSINGYDADAVQQTLSTIVGIKRSVSLYPCLVFLGGTALLFRYRINKRTETQMEGELDIRRTGLTNDIEIVLVNRQ